MSLDRPAPSRVALRLLRSTIFFFCLDHLHLHLCIRLFPPLTLRHRSLHPEPSPRAPHRCALTIYQILCDVKSPLEPRVKKMKQRIDLIAMQLSFASNPQACAHPRTLEHNLNPKP